MKVNTLVRQYVTAEIADWTGNVDNRVYGTTRDIKVALVPDNGGYAMVTDEALRRFTRVQNLRDRNGDNLLPDIPGSEAVFEVINSQAVVDAMGFLSGHRCTLRKISL